MNRSTENIAPSCVRDETASKQARLIHCICDERVRAELDTLTKVVSTPNFIKNLPFILGQSVSDIKRSRQAYIDSYAFSRDSSVVSI